MKINNIILFIPLLFIACACNTDEDEYSSFSFISEDSTVAPPPVDNAIWEDPIYEWANDYSSVTATRSSNKGDGEFETVNTRMELLSEPTCDEPGEYRYITDDFYNSSFQIQERRFSIPATGHNWNTPTYSWNYDDIKATYVVTASRRCQNDNNHVDSEVVDAVLVSTTNPTCHTLGNNHYVATFSKDCFSEQTRDDDINMLPHVYVGAIPDYDWSADGTSCTASIHCVNDGCNHIESEDASISIIDHLDVNCQNDGYNLYQASFVNELFETKTKKVDIPSTGVEHNWVVLNRSDYHTWADFDPYDNTIVIPGTATYTCTVCGGTKEDIHYVFETDIPL